MQQSLRLQSPVMLANPIRPVVYSVLTSRLLSATPPSPSDVTAPFACSPQGTHDHPIFNL